MLKFQTVKYPSNECINGGQNALTVAKDAINCKPLKNKFATADCLFENFGKNNNKQQIPTTKTGAAIK